MNAIHKIFEEYKSLDFRNKLENASGSVELTTNALGDEIVKMLKQSSDFANALANESGKLQTAVQSLTTSSNSQAQSLEETAAALEEITSSMQNVSVKTSDVIDLEKAKLFKEKDVLNYLKENKELRVKLKNILDKELVHIKQHRPDIVASWKYYQEFEKMCKELDQELTLE